MLSPRREFKKFNFNWSREILLLSFASVVFWHAQGAFASGKNQCADSLLGASAPAPRTLQEDVDKTIRALADLRLRLDLARISGSRALETTALEADFTKKEQELIAYLEDSQIMTPDELHERMKREIARLQSEQQAGQRERDQARDDEARQRREQEKQIENSIIDSRRAIFHRIEPGSFRMGEGGKQVDVTLTQPFEMMATPTTQIIWKKVAELANARFGNKYVVNADPSQFKGETHPVEKVSYDDVQTWLRSLNELSQKGEPALVDLIPGHKQGDIYRLPTEAEWEFVMRKRGQCIGDYHFGDDVSQLGDYAWFQANSGGRTQPVARKTPLVISGREFYDLSGNVWEWVHDWYDSSLPGGTDPQGSQSGSSRVLRGGSWDSAARSLRSAYRYGYVPTLRFSDVGFRLVRTAK